MKNIGLLFTLILFFIGCGDTTKTTQATNNTNPLVETPKVSKAHVDIIAEKKTLTIGIDEELVLNFSCDASVHDYKWYINDILFSHNETATLDTPDEEKEYTITLTVEDDEGILLSTSTKIIVKASTLPVHSYDPSFSSIRDLIANAHTEDVTYICYGDSTRSVSHYQNQYVFENVKDALNGFGVNSINAAVTGIRAKDAADDSFVDGNNWIDIAHMIPDDGAHTILDISLGINDYDEVPDEEIKSALKKIITSIRTTKPNTHFILTVPSRVYYSPQNMSDGLIAIYKELSNELSIPMINVPEEAMPLDELTLSWYREGDQTHLTPESQRKIANLILSKILP